MSSGDRERERERDRERGGASGGGIIATAATPLKAAANLFAGTVRWGFNLVKSPSSVSPSAAEERREEEANGSQEDQEPEGDQGEDHQQEIEQIDSPPANDKEEEEEEDGDKGQGQKNGAAALDDRRRFGGSLPDNQDAYLQSPNPYSKRKSFAGRYSLNSQGDNGNGGGQGHYKRSRYSDVYQASEGLGQQGHLPSSSHQQQQQQRPVGGNYSVNQSPRSPYENVRAILRQGRVQSSMVDRYYNNQRQYQGDPYQAYAESSRRASAGHHTPYSNHNGGGYATDAPAGTPAMQVFLPPPQREREMATGSGHHFASEEKGRRSSLGLGLAGDAAAAADQRDQVHAKLNPNSAGTAAAATPTTTTAQAMRSPVHAFQRSQWTPMRPSSTASRLKTLKRPLASSQQEQQQVDLDSAFKSPNKRLRGRETPQPVFTRSSLVSPGDRLRQESSQKSLMKTQQQNPKESQLTTETAKRILSTLDSLSNIGGGENASAQRNPETSIPQKLKFNMPETEMASPLPPPVDSLRHFSQTKTTEKKEETTDQEKAPKKWPAAFLASNRAKADQAIEDTKKEIEAAKGGAPAPKPTSTPASKGPVFNFGQSSAAPPSPIFGLQAAGEKPKENNTGLDFTFGKKGFTFGNAKPADSQVPVLGQTGDARTYTFGQSQLSQNEEGLAKAIASVTGAVPKSDRTFEFGEGKTETSLLKKANATAVEAASLPLPADDEEPADSVSAPPAIKAWPSSFLAKNKKQNDSAVAAVAEEIENAKKPPVPQASKPGVPTFNFGGPASKDDKEKDQPKFVFGAAPTPAKEETKKQDVFTFGSSAPAPTVTAPLSQTTTPPVFSFGAGKPSEPSKEADKPALSFGASSSSSMMPSTTGFAFGSQQAAATDLLAKKNKRKSEEEDVEPKKQPAFTFGAAPTAEKSIGSSLGAGQSSPFAFESSTPAAKKPAFGFGSVQSAEKKEEPAAKASVTDTAKIGAPIFAFGGTATAAKPSPAATPTFGAAPTTFGASKPAESPAPTPSSSSAATPQPFSFGASVVGQPEKKKPEVAASPLGVSTFGSANSSSAFQFGASNSAPQFGAQSSSGGTASNSSPFAFGASAPAAAEAKPATQPGSFSFGSSAPAFGGQQSQPMPTTPGVFGGSSTGGSASSGSAFAFGQSNVSAESKPAMAFGAQSSSPFGAAPPATTTSFNSFGASSGGSMAAGFGTPTPSAAPSSFTFGAGSQQPNAAAPNAATPSAFGSSAPAPAFGGMQPSFGSGAPTPTLSGPTGGFAFGASAPQAQPSFGAPGGSSTPQPAFGGFGSPMPAAGGQAAAGGFSMGMSNAGTPPTGRRKVKAKPSWRKK